jgi:hypothetical protein
MSITPLPPAPAPTDSTQQFNEKAFDWVASLEDFTTEANALAVSVNNDKNTTASIVGAAQVSANAAASSASASALSASAALGHASAAAANTNAPLWVSGTTYAAGALVYSALTGRTYRRKTAGSGTTDPSADSTNWTALFLEIQTQRPTIRPSLLLDFANTKRLDPRITFARASSARFYDGRTVAKAEENLLIRSQEFDVTAAWSAPSPSVITANFGTAPDGTSTADRVQFTAAASTFLRQAVTLIANTDYVFSIFVKATTADSDFDLSIAGGALGRTTATSSWQRFSVTFNSGATTSTFASFTNGDDSYATDVLVWGAQLEQRSSVTAYQVTTTQPITNYIPVLQSAADNVARFDHDPTTGESLGFLVEESRTNLVVRSEEIDNGVWLTKTNMSSGVNYAIAPNGTLSADQIIENTATAEHGLQSPNVDYTSGTNYTFSCYAKAAGRTILRVLLPTAAFSENKIVYFDLSLGTVTSTSGTGITTSITAVGNNWYRLSLSAASTATLTTAGAQFRLVSTGTTASYTGDGYSGIFIWGAQLEAGAFPTSYIPTVASQVTRAADAASITGANFTGFYRQDEGTVYVEAKSVNNTAGDQRLISLGVDTNNNMQLFREFGSRRPWAAVSVNGTSVINNGAVGEWLANTDRKMAFSFKTGDSVLVADAGTPVTFSASFNFPSAYTTLNIGFAFSGGSRWGSTIRKIAFYPKALTAPNLVALTS